MSIIGITGGIGSGKSMVARLLQSMGYPVYDSDAEAKQLMHSDEWLLQQLCAVFGVELYVENRLDTKRLSNIVFSEPKKLQQLNNIVHPVVKEHLRQWAEKQNSPLVFLESAILFESGFDSETDWVILVTSPLETRIQRSMQRDGCSRTQVLQRMSQQWSDEAKAVKADFIIENDELHSLITQTEAIVTQLLLGNSKQLKL